MKGQRTRKSMEVGIGQNQHVPGRGELSFRRQAVGIPEGTVSHSQFTGLTVHAFDKAVHISSDMLSYRHGGIIRRD